MFGFDLPIWALGLFSGIGRFISAAFTFLTTKPGVYLLMAAIAVGAYWYSGHEGYKRAQADDKAAYALMVAQAETVAATKARADQITVDTGIMAAAEKAAFARGKAQSRTIVLTKEIPTYVTVQTDRDFPVPCGLYRVLHAAASGPDEDPAAVNLPAGLADGDACPIAVSDLASLGVAWAGLYHQAVAQIGGLQDLARTLKEAAEK